MGIKIVPDSPKQPTDPNAANKPATDKPATPAATTTTTTAPPQTGPAPWNVKMVDINGVPRRVDMRMTSDPASMQAQKGMPIACPVLGALVAEGKLHVDANGRVKTDEMLAALKERGLTPALLETLRGISYFANAPSDIARNTADQSFDIMHLRSGLTMHDADSNILATGRFDEKAFDRFTSHAKDGYMDANAFAAAIKDQTEQDVLAQGGLKLEYQVEHPINSLLGKNPHSPVTPLTFGQNAVLAEYPILLKVFNTKGPDGQPAVSVDALKAFWKDGKLPPEAAGPDTITMPDTLKAYASMLGKIEPKMAGDAFRSTLTATGQALDGARLSTKDEPKERATLAASVGAGQAMKCPALNGSIGMQVPVQANVDLHTQ